MSVAAEAISPVSLHHEWGRVELLARCLLMARSGKQPGDDSIARLRQLQQQVEQLRASDASPWRRLTATKLSALALDILACVYASEAQPKIALLYQDLQSSQQSVLTPATLQVLLALDDYEGQMLLQLLQPGGELLRNNLVRVEGEGALALVQPERSRLSQLCGWPAVDFAPPGAYLVAQTASWDDLVLPAERRLLIREYLLWLQHRQTVVHEWGGHSTGGPIALFSGASGTGKTFAASVIANELGWPLYRVDLARLVSKYIGETEKNIGRLLDAAHGRELVLQFDEVDALMSKRGEIKEARDRYANMEVSYLLARIEDHDGPCILTTNLRTQIDKAFSRRFQIVVEFPRPDAAARSELWRRMLPPRAPMAPEVDLAFLGAAVSLTGGNIRNAALHAAYLAAGEQAPIRLSHIAVGVWRELAKDRVQVPRSDLGGLAGYLPSAVVESASGADQ